MVELFIKQKVLLRMQTTWVLNFFYRWSLKDVHC